MCADGIEDMKDDLENIEFGCNGTKWYERQQYCYVCICNSLLLVDTISCDDIEDMKDDLDNSEFGSIQNCMSIMEEKSPLYVTW